MSEFKTPITNVNSYLKNEIETSYDDEKIVFERDNENSRTMASVLLKGETSITLKPKAVVKRDVGLSYPRASEKGSNSNMEMKKVETNLECCKSAHERQMASGLFERFEYHLESEFLLNLNPVSEKCPAARNRATITKVNVQNEETSILEKLVTFDSARSSPISLPLAVFYGLNKLISDVELLMRFLNVLKNRLNLGNTKNEDSKEALHNIPMTETLELIFNLQKDVDDVLDVSKLFLSITRGFLNTNTDKHSNIPVGFLVGYVRNLDIVKKSLLSLFRKLDLPRKNTIVDEFSVILCRRISDLIKNINKTLELEMYRIKVLCEKNSQ